MNYCQFRNDFIKRMANAGGGLPSIYQAVEYLESSYTQYIDTLYVPTTNNLRIVTRLNVLREGNADDRFFGSQNGTSCALPPWFYGGYGGTKPLGLIAAGTSYYLGRVNTSYNTIYDIDITANNGRLTGDYCGYTLNTTYSGSVGNNLSIYIFNSHINNPEAGKYKCYARFYKFEIYSGGEQRFNGIPCYRKSDSKPGMYDLVTNTFFTNAGTGEFTVGNDVV